MKKNKHHSKALTQDIVNSSKAYKKVCICVPTTGNLRMEWVLSRYGCIIPVNWSNGDILMYFDQFSPSGYMVADARNICVEYSISQGFEWTLFIDHDTCIPPDTFLKLGEYMREMKYPVVSGLYYCKGNHPEPLIFRGRGNGYYDKWKFGDKVMVDGIPMGCVIIHNSLLKLMYNESEVYTAQSMSGPVVVRRVFETPRMYWVDPETGKSNSRGGTEDITWCERVIKGNYLERAGWSELAKEKFPFLIDTSIFCQHIDNNGIRYPGQMYRQFAQYKDSKLEAIEKKGNVYVGTTGTQY